MSDFLPQHSDIAQTPFADGITVSNPATQEVIAYVRATSPAELNQKIEQAQLAQSEWANKTALERADVLWRWYHAIQHHQADLARLMTIEQGKCLAEAQAEIQYAASFIRWFAEEARRINGDVLSSVRSSQKLLVLKQAIGVTAAITPWNFPAAMITRKAAPALAAGCAMLIKPASQTPLTAYALAKLAYQAGVPQDLMPIVCGRAADMAQTFADNPTIRKISFTGSTEVGRHIFRQSAQHIKKLSLELGGNAPFIVFDDANLHQAIDGLISSKFRNSGQTCVCTNRVYVQRNVYDEFCQLLVEKTKKLVLGNGLDEGVQQGPLIDEQAVLKAEKLIADAVCKGAVCLTGGKRSSLGGTFFEPTVLKNAQANMLLAQEESFAPICPIFVFDNENEVIHAANNTPFGLAAYVFTRHTARQWRIAEALEYGMVGINTGIISNEVAPFGGVKQSGLGREGSQYGIDEYLEIKYVCLDLSE